MDGVVNFDDFKWITLWLRTGTSQQFLVQWKQRPDAERKRVLAWLTTNPVIKLAFEKKFRMRPLYDILHNVIGITGESVPDRFWLHCLNASHHVSLSMLEHILVRNVEHDMIEALLKRIHNARLKQWSTRETLYIMCINFVPAQYIDQLLCTFQDDWNDGLLITAYENSIEVGNHEAKNVLISFMTAPIRERLLRYCCRNEYWDDAKMLITDYSVTAGDHVVRLCADNKDMMAFLFPKRIKI